MMDEVTKKIYDYIMTHGAKATALETIDAAIGAVMEGWSLATYEDLVNKDDAWLISDEKRSNFAGIRGYGSVQSLDPDSIRILEEAARFVMRRSSEHKDDYVFDNMDEVKKGKENDDLLDDIQELKNIRNELIEKTNYNNLNLNDNYVDEQNTNKIVK